MTPTHPLTIVHGYQGMATYIQAARQKPSSEWIRLWHEHAVAPYWQEWAAGQFNEERIRQQMQTPIMDLEPLAEAVELLSQSGVEQIVRQAYDRITAILPPQPSERAVCIYALDPQDHKTLERQNGVVGSCVGDNILLQINPHGTDWQAWTQDVLAHEYHHSIWGYNYFVVRKQTRMDLLTSFIVDGQADSFAKALYPGLKASWVSQLSPAQEREQWQKVQPYLKSEDPADYARFMFGSEAEGIPWCLGYALGFRIIQAFLKVHPQVTWTELLDQDPWDLLTESGYEPETG